MPDVVTAIDHELLERLLAEPLLQTIVSNRGYLVRAPQDAPRPYLIVNSIISEPVTSLAGQIGLARTLVQIDCWADGTDGRVTARRAGHRIGGKGGLFDSFKGTLVTGGLAIDSTRVTRLDFTGQRPEDGSDDYVYRVSIDVEIYHQTLTEA